MKQTTSPSDAEGLDPASLGSGNLEFVEALYERYRSAPESVDPVWRDWFETLPSNGVPRLQPSFTPRSIFDPAGPGRGPTKRADAQALQDKVDQLVRAFRVRGHLLAQLDPLGLPREPQPETEPAFYGLNESHMGLRFSGSTVEGPARLTLAELLTRLRNTYCRSIGVQFMHIDELHVKQWLQERMEGTENRLSLSRDQQLRILTALTDAVLFERFISKKYIGAKRFSLEGAESLIPLLDLAVEKSADQGVEEIVIGMAHRGRLNVLCNITGKSPAQIFREFEDRNPEGQRGRGDVKYHLGHSCDRVTANGNKVHLSLCFNPSHLECVGPVAVGRVRAKQDRFGDIERARGMALVIHGDAAFAGQGVVQETLNLSELVGYRTGGTLHIVVNNQIGFTTGPQQGRSPVYATDVAKMLHSPIFHVNGEDPEAVAQVVNLALDFRRQFRRDVVIDMYCYRRLGHNEGDEPSFTQPLMYAAIKKRKSVRQGYLDSLLKMGEVTRDEADAIFARRQHRLEENLESLKEGDAPEPEFPPGAWGQYRGGPDSETAPAETGVPLKTLATLLEAQTRYPEGFQPHRTIDRLLKERAAMARGEKPLNWAAAELLALATLAAEGAPVRLTGQDTERGTFSHRHAVLYDQKTGEMYRSLQHVATQQAPVEVRNSPLSEQGVLGFEYGYSLDTPNGLVAWEAQFGDFHNVAQPFIDQFLVSAEDKWGRLSGLVLLLPHGFEGMGPEHSSARLERFLALAAEDNIQVAQPTTPAQLFHLLRRQVIRKWRKPLVVMTPKSLLRHPKVISSMDELAGGHFQRVLRDQGGGPVEQVTRVLLCSGKIYYELWDRREQLQRPDVWIVRFEQLYPLADAAILEALEGLPENTEAVWVQEEPENMGSSRYLLARHGERLAGRFPLRVVTRPASASPATGSAKSHKLEQEEILDAAFAK